MTGYSQILFRVELTSEERQLLEETIAMIRNIAALPTGNHHDKVVYDPEVADLFESLWRAMNTIDWTK